MADAAHEVRFYWRPGCGFCANLRRKLASSGVRYRAINIWEDPEAAAHVRAVAGGNETVPTVIVGSRAMVNPNLKEVLTAISEEIPESRDVPVAARGAQSPGLLASVLGKLRDAGR
jgi:mycoredoxin